MLQTIYLQRVTMTLVTSLGHLSHCNVLWSMLIIEPSSISPRIIARLNVADGRLEAEDAAEDVAEDVAEDALYVLVSLN